jgi:hypothetical protein
LDILHASRSILWLKPNFIVVYDRATSHSAGLFKRFNLVLTATPTVQANLITTTTPNGQKLYLTSLLPSSSTVPVTQFGNSLNPIAQLEPSTCRLAIEDPSGPTDTRFLHVLQGADPGVPAAQGLLVQSNSGTHMDGAVLGASAILFMRDATVPFTGTSYTVPAGVNQHYVTGCVPNTSYTVNASANSAGTLVTIMPGGIGSAVADSVAC